MRPWLASIPMVILPVLSMAQDAATSDTIRLIVVSQSMDGLPLQDVRFQATLPDGTTQELTTDARGRARPLRTTSAETKLRLLSDNYRIASEQRTGTGDATSYLFVRLVEQDTQKMSLEERRAYVANLPEILRIERRRHPDLPGSPDEPSLLRISAFLEGSREEVPHATADTTTVSPHVVTPDLDPSLDVTPEVTATVVSPTGQPLANRLVLLFSQVEDSGQIQVLASDTTDSRGQVRFIRLPQRRFLRLEAPVDLRTGSSAAARSTVFLLASGQRHTINALPVRFSASGFVFHNDRPLPNATVALHGGALTATTDRMGFYETGTTLPQILGLAVRAPGPQRLQVELPNFLSAGRETIIPFDVLLAPEPRTNLVSQ